MKKQKTITICASTSFYKDALAIEQKLLEQGFRVLLPEGAKAIKADPGFDPDLHKADFIRRKNFVLKKQLIDKHFAEIKKADAVLIVNNEKKGIKGYIGGNVLMEMTVAYLLGKAIYVWRDIDHAHPFIDEVRAITTTFLNGDISHI